MFSSQNSQTNYFQIARIMRICVLVLMLVLVFVALAYAGPGEKAPTRAAAEGSGPHAELILRGVNIINGEGAPMRGPVDIVIKKNA